MNNKSPLAHKQAHRSRSCRVSAGIYIGVDSARRRSLARSLAQVEREIERKLQASMAAKSALQPLLRYLKVPVQPLGQNIFSVSPHLFRRFSTEEVRGCFLDKSEVTDRVISVVKNFEKVNPSKVNPSAHFQNDLGLDSLDSVEIVMALEEEFGFEIPDNEADKINSINLAVDFIASHPQAK